MDDSEQYASAAASAWEHLCATCLANSPDRVEQLAGALAARTGGLKASFKQKLRAIWDAKLAGMSREEIISAGQSSILQRFARTNGHHDEPYRILRWRVSKGLADAIMSEDTNPDTEEALVTRISRVLEIQTSEELWLFLHSVFSDWSDEELLHAAGEFNEKKKLKKTSAPKL